MVCRNRQRRRKKNVTQFNASFDGSEFTQGSQTSIMLRVDRYTTERINKTDGKVTLFRGVPYRKSWLER